MDSLHAECICQCVCRINSVTLSLIRYLRKWYACQTYRSPAPVQTPRQAHFEKICDVIENIFHANTFLIGTAIAHCKTHWIWCNHQSKRQKTIQINNGEKTFHSYFIPKRIRFVDFKELKQQEEELRKGNLSHKHNYLKLKHITMEEASK